MSSGTPLDKQLAETVGKRLARQAAKVSDELTAVADRAEQERAAAREAVGLAGLAVDPQNDRLQAELSERLAAIDTREVEGLDLLRREEYVGFWELGLGVPEVPLAVTPANPVLQSNKMTEEQLANMMTEEEEAEYDAERARMAQWRLQGGPLPPEIARRLGVEGCRMIEANGGTGDEILQIAIPLLVSHLLSERVRVQEEHEGDLALEREQCESCVASWKDMHGEASEESDRLRVELAKAEARVEELRDVIGLLKK